MSGLLQEFFWTPPETVRWAKNEASAFGLWVVLWIVGKDARVIDAKELQPIMLDGHSEDAIQLFLGSADISGAPAWRNVEGRRLLEFQSSYAVQLVPPVVAPDHETLLQGRLAILRPDQYDDPTKAQKLLALFRTLRASLKRESDHSRWIVQILSNGEKKTWKNILVGKCVPGPGVKRLKQFAKGEVAFEVTTS